MPLVPHADILALHAAAIACGHAARRATLLGGLDPHLVAGLPGAHDPSSQLLNDLGSLNALGRLPDGSTPLLLWATNAAALAGPHPDAAVFRNLVARLGGAPVATPATQAPAAPGAPVAPAPGVAASTGRRSLFISYGGPDEAFARRLHEALERNGVATFFFPEHAPFGMPLHQVMREGVNKHDRMLLLCSRASLSRSGVLNEIEELLRREGREGGQPRLIPIALDDYVFTDWPRENPALAQTVRDRVVADFRGAATDAARFDAMFRRLLAALA